MQTQATEPVGEFQELLGEMRSGWSEIRQLPGAVRELREEGARAKQQLAELRRSSAVRAQERTRARPHGSVSAECAEHVAATFIAHCERSGKLEALCSVPSQRDALVLFARDRLGLTTRAALTTTEIPLPVQYGSELRELISDFGVVRRQMTNYPIGLGTARPRGWRASVFGSIAMSGVFPEKSPSITFASLESHKWAARQASRELDEQSIVMMGRFAARYGAIEFARAEDSWDSWRTGRRRSRT